MYKTIVKRRIRSLFAEANRGNWQVIVDSLNPTFTYRFIGDTPLGGTRNKKSSMQDWFRRIYRLVPDAKLTPQTIVVDGMPWNTQIMTYVKFSGTLPSVEGAKGVPYENEVMQLMQLKWGRIHSVLTIEDTQRFVNILPLLSRAGIAEANAAPIDDTSTN
jgi:ketosteroid isomerase-like protein